MKTLRFEFSSEIQASAEEVWAFHIQPDALERLSPGWMGLRVADRGRGVAEGSEVRFEVGPWPFRIRWNALHAGIQANRSFSDIALRSPFRYWLHQHEFESMGPARCRLRDVIWVLPPAWMPKWVARPLLRFGLRMLFTWRHRTTRRAVALSASVKSTAGKTLPAEAFSRAAVVRIES